MSEEVAAAVAPISPTDPFAWWTPVRNIGPELIMAMNAARKLMRRIEASGENTYDGYKYSSMKDYTEGIEEGLSDNGLIVVVEMVKPKFFNTGREKVPSGCHALLCGHVYHATGQSMPFMFLGEAMDRADKASYKATTGGRKYALSCLFNLKGGTDPESDESVSKAAAEGDNPFRGGKKQSNQRGAKAPAAAPPAGDAAPADPPKRGRDPLTAWQKKFVDAKDSVAFDIALKAFQECEAVRTVPGLFGKVYMFAGQNAEARKQRGQFKPDDPAVEAIEDRMKALGETLDAIEAQEAQAAGQEPPKTQRGVF